MEKGGRLGGALFQEWFLQGDLNAWSLRELGALNSAMRDLSSRSDETLPVGVDSWRNERTRLWFDLPVILDSFLSVATIFWTGDI